LFHFFAVATRALNDNFIFFGKRQGHSENLITFLAPVFIYWHLRSPFPVSLKRKKTVPLFNKKDSFVSMETALPEGKNEFDYNISSF
jgi:hypothetical protein